MANADAPGSPLAPEGPARLRFSTSLSRVPAETAPAAPTATTATVAAAPAAVPEPAAPTAAPVSPPVASVVRLPATEAPIAPVVPPPAKPAPPEIIKSARASIENRMAAARADLPEPRQLMALTATAAAAFVALVWVVERRRRRYVQDSVLWAGVQPRALDRPAGAGALDDILPDGPSPAEAARSIYVTAIGETNSRREATLIDLHQLQSKLERRRKRGDNVAAVLLLQQHLVDFRYSSPWVFLELRELYRLLDKQQEWDIARETFRARFGQNAPLWAAPSTAGAELAEDDHLSGQLRQVWPYRPARMWILRWMLGEPEMRMRGLGPPLLPLGVYRDLMTLDDLLDEVMVSTSPAAAASPSPSDHG